MVTSAVSFEQKNSSGSGNIRLNFKIQNFLSKHACLFHFCLTNWKKNLFWGTTFRSAYNAFQKVLSSSLPVFITTTTQRTKWWHWFDICYSYYHTFFTQNDQFVEFTVVELFSVYSGVFVCFRSVSKLYMLGTSEAFFTRNYVKMCHWMSLRIRKNLD